MRMPWIWLSIVWVVCGAAICFAIFVTKSPYCLFALLIPGCIGFTSSKDRGEEEVE